MDQVAYLFERVLRARSPQDNIEQRADEFGGGAQKVNLSRDQIQPGEFLALDQVKWWSDGTTREEFEGCNMLFQKDDPENYIRKLLEKVVRPA
jgi:hypothetical protein